MLDGQASLDSRIKIEICKVKVIIDRRNKTTWSIVSKRIADTKWDTVLFILTFCFSVSCLANPVTLKQTAHSGIRAADFVGRTQGKLRDFYRIGKILGTGKWEATSFIEVNMGFFLLYWLTFLITNFVVLGAFGEVRKCERRDSGA